MHDHEFEKQVHQKMEELSLTPSDAVWTNVEGQLHEKKRRRRLLWLPFIFLFGILGGYFSLQHFYPSAQPTLARSNKKIAKVSDRKHTIPVSANEKKDSKVKDIATVRATGSKQENRDEAELKIQKRNQPQPHLAAVHHASGMIMSDKKLMNHPAYSGNKHKPAGKTIAVAVVQTDTKELSDKKTGRIKRSDGSGAAIGSTIENTVAVITVEDTAMSQAGQELFKVLSAAVIDSVVLRKEAFYTHFSVIDDKSSASQTVRLTKKKRLSWGFSLQAGKTSLTDGKLDKLFTSSARNDNFAFSTVPAGGGIIVPPVLSSDIQVQARTGFSAGFFLRSRLNSRLALSGGLNYSLFTTSFTIRNSNTFINRYHFIELPLLLQTQLNSSIKTPLIWEAGISLSRLISSNALHFDSTSNRLYKNNRLFNHTQVSLLTGLYLQVFSSSKYPFRIGPQLQYGVIRLLSGNTDKRDHLLEYGLKISTVIK